MRAAETTRPGSTRAVEGGTRPARLPAGLLAVIGASLVAVTVLASIAAARLADGAPAGLPPIAPAPAASVAPADAATPAEPAAAPDDAVALPDRAGGSLTLAAVRSATAAAPGASGEAAPVTAAVALPPPAGGETTATTTPGPPPRLAVSTDVVDLGADATSATLVITNAGGSTLEWRVTPLAAPFRLAGVVSPLAAGQGARLAVLVDRQGAAEGDHVAELLLDGDGRHVVTVLARVEHAPTAHVVSGPSPAARDACDDTPIAISVAAGDESGVATVELRWTGPGGAGSTAAAPDGALWTAALRPQPVAGMWGVEIVVTDVRGNATSLAAPFELRACAT